MSDHHVVSADPERALDRPSTKRTIHTTALVEAPPVDDVHAHEAP